ncbi:phosphoglycerate/bisphosphoglycerate mutase [Zea mays]|uniref:phosphoglycerate mutase (2,3-diphosphoglycerate-dependent) n=1 Tax=Zea mays TaxID=4577 RepID=A0A1D6K4Z1_MAIZE|nr:phosphoglycerate/bisphosphoglycerate mutase [Zea mays]
MAGAISHHALAFSQSHWCSAKNSRFGKRTGNARLVYLKGRCGSGSRKLGLMWASSSQSSVMEPTHLPSDGNSSHTPKKSSESALILIWHGESLWNEKNLFPGCIDVPLTPKGVEEAIEAGKRICNIPIDVIYTSSLICAQMTAMLAMMQHRRKKVCVFPLKFQYGELQGLNKQETVDRFGKEQVHEWRRSYDIPPPNGESLEKCAERAVAYFKDQAHLARPLYTN